MREEFNAKQDIALMNTEKAILEEKLQNDIKTKEMNNANLIHEREQNQKLNLAKLSEL